MTEDDLKAFTDRVKAELKAKGLTQKAFEEQHDLASGTLTRVFGGRKELDDDTLGAIAKGLGVTAGTLTGQASAAKAAAPKAQAQPAAKAAAKPADAPKAEPPAAPEPKAPAPTEAKRRSEAPTEPLPDDEDTVRVTPKDSGVFGNVRGLGRLLRRLTQLFRRG